jgi:hypothetical protein
LASWKDLAGEIARIGHLQTAGLGAGGTVVETGKIVATMKGPLGLITIGAAGIVAVSTILNNAAVEINVRNQGCRPIEPMIQKTIDIPGLKLPSAEISNGKTDVVKIPGLAMMVTINRGNVSLGAFNLERNYGLPNEITDIIYDGESLMGKTTKVELGNAKKHDLVLICGNKQ